MIDPNRGVPDQRLDPPIEHDPTPLAEWLEAGKLLRRLVEIGEVLYEQDVFGYDRQAAWACVLACPQHLLFASEQDACDAEQRRLEYERKTR